MKSTAIAILIAGAMASGACAPMMMAPPQQDRRANANDAARFSPVGRWDQVLSLRPNWVIEIIDGQTVLHTGRFVRADVSSLTLVTHGGERVFERRNVMRVRLLAAPDAARKKKVFKGAVAGSIATAVAVSILPSALGGKVWVPPPRVWAVGAAYGAAETAIALRLEGRPRTIYVARFDGM